MIHAPQQQRKSFKYPIMAKVAKDFFNYFIYQLQGNCIAKTQNGLLANIPQQSEVGDIIAILYGWNTPFLLRPIATGYLLIGECYVHGIMHGEAMEKNMGVEKDFALV